MACNWSHRLSAYHDGELDVAARAEVERHIAQCPECARELAEMASLSRMMLDNPPQRLSQIGLHRLHNRVDVVVRADVLRTARVLQAIAACVLIGTSIMMMRMPEIQNTGVETAQVQPQSPPPWVDLAVNVTAETTQIDATTPAAAWYLADISSRSDDLP